MSDHDELTAEPADADADADTEVLPPELSGGRWTKIAVGLCAVVLVGIVVAAVVALQSDDEGGASVTLDEAQDARVVLPGGVRVAAEPGLVMPEGTRIVTGVEGHVRAGEVEMGPRRVGRVRDGHLFVYPSIGETTTTATGA